MPNPSHALRILGACALLLGLPSAARAGSEPAAPEAPDLDRSSASRPADLVDPAGSAEWERTLERVVRGVVSIRVTAVRDFDTEDASVSQGTGFVIDAEQGLILTNRHMVHAGPVVAEAVFLDDEEVELEPVYRDPVHDFGIYRFDPAAVHEPVVELPLAPEAARQGIEIRVVGNDAGEKVSILDGTLARLDRNAPFYGGDDYNDFNTFYLQAASNTSGGSSGSPVVDKQGRVVALNAGGATQAASSFYLPLDRVVWALAKIRAHEAVPRGSLQTMFTHTPFDELARLGLRPETATVVRKALTDRAPNQRFGPTGYGMLVVDQVLPEGPADGKLKPGDILVRLDGRLATDFVQLESTLDGAVGHTVQLEVERGGKPLELDVPVQDLHAITPSEYLEVGRGILHTLSYMQAHNHNLPVKGVYLAVGGYIWSTAEVPEGAIISDVDGVPTPDLDTMQRQLESKADGQRVRLRFWMVGDPNRAYETVMVMDRRWYPMQRCRRDDATGLWPCTASPPPPPLVPPPPAEKLPVFTDDPVAASVAPSLVLVSFDIPWPTSGVKDLNYVGVGTVIDAERGLVLVDRDTVPVALGDMTLTFAGTVRVPGHLVYLHPTHDIAVVRYDPTLLGDLAVRSAVLDATPLQEGDRAWLVGLDHDSNLVSKRTKVRAVEPMVIGLATTPRFRDANIEVVRLDEAVDSYGGVLVDHAGRVYALWASFLDQASGDRELAGLPLAFVLPVVQPILAGKDPRYRTLGIELAPIPLAQARDRGLSDDRVRELLAHDPKGRRILEVQRVHGRSPAKDLVRDTDLLIAVDGRPITSPVEVEEAQARDAVVLTLLRDAHEIEVEVPTFEIDGNGVDRVVSWAGLVLHEPHDDVAAQRGVADPGVYIAWLWFGTPAARYGIRPTRRIVSVDDMPTPTLDAFLEAVAGMRDRQSVRLTMAKLDGGEMVATLKLDLQYWPTEVIELAREGDGPPTWVRHPAPTKFAELGSPEGASHP